MSEWIKYALSDIGEFFDGPHATPTRTDSGPYFLNISSLVNGRLDLSLSDHVSDEDFTRWTRRVTPNAGDLLFSYETRLGDAALMPEGIQACLGRRMALLRPDRKLVEPRFLLYLYLSPIFRRLIEKNTVQGATVNRIALSTMPHWAITLPPLPQQRAIAEVLGALDDRIAANTKTAEIATQLSGLIYDEAVALTPVQPMSAVLSPILGGTPSRARPDFWSGQRLWASARDVTGADDGVIIDTEEKISDIAVDSTKAKPLSKGGVILTARGTVGRVARLAVPASFNQSCYGFEPGVLPAAILYLSILRSAKKARSLAHGSVFDTITMSTFDHLDVPALTPIQVSEIDCKVSPLLEVVTSSVLENKALAATRDALLPQLVSGRLRVKDAEKAVEGVL